MQTVRRAVIAFSLLLATILVVPATSSAATYIDWECAGPSGAPTAARGFEAHRGRRRRIGHEHRAARPAAVCPSACPARATWTRRS